MASIILESSPPEAIFDNGFKFSPGFVDIINLTLSQPFEDKDGSFAKSILNFTSKKLRFFKEAMNCSASFISSSKL